MKIKKKDLYEIILFTICLIFFFVYIDKIFFFVGKVIHWFMPFIVGVCIAFVLNVLVSVIETKWLKKWHKSDNTKRIVSLCIAMAMIIGFFLLLFFLLIPSIIDTITIFANNVESYIASLRDFLEKLNINDNIIGELSAVLKNLGDTASEFIKNNSDQVIETTLGVATNVVTGFVNVTIGIVFAIYYLAQKEKIGRQLKKLLEAYVPPKGIKYIYKVKDVSNRVFTGFVSGQCLEALIIGVLCFIGMVLLRLPYATSISVLVGFTALIPVFGAFIGTALGAFLIFMINPLQALIFVIFIIVLQQFEGNLIYPRVVGKSVGLPGIWTFVAVTVGASTAGVLGMLLSVPIASIVYSMLSTSVHNRLDNKDLKSK